MQRVGKVEIYALQGGKSREVQPRFAKAHLVMLRGREAATRLRGRDEAARPR